MLQNHPDEDSPILDWDINKINSYLAFIRIGWKLAKARKQDEQNKNTAKVDKLINSRKFKSFNENTLSLIERIATHIQNSTEFDANAKVPFNTAWTEEQSNEFLNKNKIVQTLLEDEDLRSMLEVNIRISKNINKAANWVNNIATMLNHMAVGFPVPPADWILRTLSCGLNVVSIFGSKQAMKYNPEFNTNKNIAGVAVQGGLSGGFAIAGIALGATTSATSIGGPILLAIGSAIGMIKSGYSLVKNIKALVKEVKENKEPKETYRWRVFNKVLGCNKHALQTAFYACLTALAVIAIVAIVANPYGLAAVVGIAAGIGIGIAVVSIANLALRAFARWKIRKIEQQHNIAHPHKSMPKDTLLSRGKKAIQRLGRQHELNNKEKQGLKHKGTVINPVQSRNKKKTSKPIVFRSHQYSELHVHSAALSKEKYHEVAKTSEQVLKDKISENAPELQGVKLKHSHKNKDKNQEDILIVKIPRNQKLEVEQGATNKALEYDEMHRRQAPNGIVEISLTKEATDNSVFMALEINKDFAPLKLGRSNDALLSLKMLEAAKLAGVELELHPEDRKLLINSKDPALREYAKAIEHLDPKALKTLLQNKKGSKTERKLGDIPHDFHHRMMALNLKSAKNSLVLKKER